MLVHQLLLLLLLRRCQWGGPPLCETREDRTAACPLTRQPLLQPVALPAMHARHIDPVTGLDELALADAAIAADGQPRSFASTSDRRKRPASCVVKALVQATLTSTPARVI